MMKKERNEWWKIIVFPHWFIKVLLVIISTVLLIYSLGFENPNPVIAYISYGLSAYTLTIVVIKVPKFVQGIKKRLYANKYTGKLLSEPVFRAKVSLYISSGVNILYAFFYFGAGVYYRSVWIIAIAVYYVVLSIMRFGLIRRDRNKFEILDETERRKYEIKSCHACGCFMFLLNIAVSGLVVQMIWQNKYYDYPGFMIYAQAAYSFYSLTMAIMNLVKYRKMERPILSAAKMISMTCALMSILTLQTAMLMQFGNGEKFFMRLMNSLTGGAVCFSVFVMAVWLVHKARKEMK